MDSEINNLKRKITELEIENSNLKQQQIEINEAKNLYLKIFEDFPALIWRSRLDKLCDYFNKTWLEFTGRTFEQEFGNGWTEGVHPEDFDVCLETYVEAFDRKESFSMDYRLKNKFGEYRWIRDFGRPFYDIDITFLGYIGSCYDITENKNNELKLIELNSTKDKFFSIIAHDLRSPFNSIIGLCSYLIEKVKEKDYEQIEEFAYFILQSSNKAMDLLSNLMEWAKTQSGKMKFKPEKIDFSNLLENMLLLFKANALQKSITIINNVSPNIYIVADKEMISSVMRNLLSNAIKFTEFGGIITISSLIDNQNLIFKVADNGVGISKDRIDKMFKIGEGYSTQGTQKEPGTGLGLVLSKEFIERHEGKIWVESENGAIFYFSIPHVV